MMYFYALFAFTIALHIFSPHSYRQMAGLLVPSESHTLWPQGHQLTPFALKLYRLSTTSRTLRIHENVGLRLPVKIPLNKY